jgi:hypothetical protein
MPGAAEMGTNGQRPGDPGDQDTVKPSIAHRRWAIQRGSSRIPHCIAQRLFRGGVPLAVRADRARLLWRFFWFTPRDLLERGVVHENYRNLTRFLAERAAISPPPDACRRPERQATLDQMCAHGGPDEQAADTGRLPVAHHIAPDRWLERARGTSVEDSATAGVANREEVIHVGTSPCRSARRARRPH